MKEQLSFLFDFGTMPARKRFKTLTRPRRFHCKRSKLSE